MANIITSKSKRRIERNRTVIQTNPNGFKKQWAGVRANKTNSQEYLFEKRVQELHNQGFNEDAICGMMHGENDKGQKGEIKKIILRKGNIILDGNI
jgi:hypothetical protein